MANRPKKGGGSSSGGGGGGGGFLQGLFGPQANADFGKEQGEADFQNPTPVEQPYQSPSLWQRFLAPEQSRAAEAANIGAVRDNILLTKDQAFRAAQREAEEKAALNRAITLENLRAQNAATADETRRLNEETFNREVFDRARTAKLSDEERAKQDALEAAKGAAYQKVQGLLTAGGIPASVKIPSGYLSNEEYLNLANAIDLARGSNALTGSDVYSGKIAAQKSENALKVAKDKALEPLQGKLANLELQSKQGDVFRQSLVGFPFQRYDVLSGKPVSMGMPPMAHMIEGTGPNMVVNGQEIPGTGKKIHEFKQFPGFYSEVSESSGPLGFGPSAKKPVNRISLDTSAPAPSEVLTKENNALPLPKRKLFPHLDPSSLLPSRVTTKSEPFQARQFQTILTPEEEAQRMLMLKSFLTK